MLAFLNQIYAELTGSFFLAETYTLPTLWTNLLRLSLFSLHCVESVTLVPEARPFFAAAYKPLHGILRQALILSNVRPDVIRSMGVRDETNWRYQLPVMGRVFVEFHEALERSRDILLNNFSAPAVRFPFFEALKLLGMGFERCSSNGEVDFQIYTAARYYLKYMVIPFGVPTSNSPLYFARMNPSAGGGATEERIALLATFVATEDNDGLCVICQEDFKVGEDMCYLPCEHHFHRSCVVEWLRKNGSCPLDRIRI